MTTRGQTPDRALCSFVAVTLLIAACGGTKPSQTPSPEVEGAPSPVPASSQTSTPNVTPDVLSLAQGQLFFARYDVDIADTIVWVARGDGSEERQLVPGPHYLSCVTQSTVVMAGPNAEGRVVISAADLDGSPYGEVDVRNASLNLGVGACSSDGSTVCAEGWVDGDASAAGIYAVDIHHGTARRITKPPAGQHDIPGCVTADGQRIAFIRADVGHNPGLLYTVVVDGTDVVKVASQPFDSGPACAPDGTTYLVERDSMLFLVAAADGRVTEITSASPAFAAHKYGPSFAGDKGILFSVQNPGPFHDIYAMRLDGTGLTRITRHPSTDNESPRFVLDP